MSKKRKIIIEEKSSMTDEPPELDNHDGERETEEIDEEEIDDLTDADDSSPIDTAPPSHSVTKDPAALLQQLKELKEEGIISEDEYRAKARKIFDSI